MDNNQENNQNSNLIPNGTVNINGQQYQTYVAEPDSRPQDNQRIDSQEDNKKANILCAISLVCWFIVPLIISAISKLYTNSFYSYSNGESECLNIIGAGSGLSIIAGIVLMIIVRVKYPNNTFGKVVMWLFIVLTVLAVISVILMIAFLWTLCKGCEGMLG